MMSSPLDLIQTLNSNLPNGFVGTVSDGHIQLYRLLMVEGLAEKERHDEMKCLNKIG